MNGTNFTLLPGHGKNGPAMAATSHIRKQLFLHAAQQALPGGFQAADHPGQVLFGFPGLPEGPDIEISVPAAADGIPLLPQMVYHLVQPGFADAQDVSESPAWCCMLPAGTRTFQVCQQLFFFSHDRSLPGSAFPKMGAKKEGAAVPFRKTAHISYLILHGHIPIMPGRRGHPQMLELPVISPDVGGL